MKKEARGKVTPLSQIPWRGYLESKNYDKDISTMCDTCRAGQIKKHGKITIKCKGLAKKDNFIPKELNHLLSEEEKQQVEEIVNPYAWAEAHIASHLFASRWYQEFPSRCTSKRKVLRMGRRTGKSYKLALNIIHKVLTNANFKVLIVTPYEVQAEELINYIRDFVYNLDEGYGNPKDILIRDVKSPTFKMEFSNGSRIRAFTTGSSGAASVRGQRADLIVLDEVDYMSEADFGSILAILMDNPDVEMWVASTPDGKKTLHKLEQMKEYKSFHYPSFVLPHFTDDLNNELREEYTDIQYVQEVMAEYGESLLGVFQSYFIDKSMFGNLEPIDVLADRDRYIIILGGDWNDDKIGTRLVVTAFDRVDKKIRIVEKCRVSKEGWTQVEAVQSIINLNRKYVFDHIYLDEGYGRSSIQFIKKYAMDNFGKLPANHPDLKLVDVVGINFSSSLTIKDVYTNQEVKKDMKVYIVDNTVRFLEKGAIVFDSEEDLDLTKQMENYIIIRRTPTGKPVYGQDDEKIGDHDLDAFMLALLGFTLEYTELIHNDSDMAIEFVTRDEIDKNHQDENSFMGRMSGQVAAQYDQDNGLFAKINMRNEPSQFMENKTGSSRTGAKDNRKSNRRILNSPEELHKDPDFNYNRSSFNKRNTKKHW